MRARPEYNLEKGMWSVPHRAAQAATLRELKTKLPGVEFIDYYPDGNTPPTDWGPMVDNVLPPARPVINRPRSLHPMRPKRKNGPERKLDWNKILDLWAAGKNTTQIADIIGGTNAKAIAGIIYTSRERDGDPRAAKRVGMNGYT